MAVINLSDAGNKLVREILQQSDDLDVSEIRWIPTRSSAPKASTAQHALEVNDAYISLMRGIGMVNGVNLFAWYNDQQLSKLREIAGFTSFFPDGLCIVSSDRRGICPVFVEVDRATETVWSDRHTKSVWADKIRSYGAYLKDQGWRYDVFWREELGYSLEEVQDPKQWANPIVLTITTSPERVNLMLEATAKAGGGGTYWYTSQPELYATWDAIQGKIWRTNKIVESDDIGPVIISDPSPRSLFTHLLP
jgi:hypothetical protein